MKFTTLIPLRFNDGREVSPEQMSRILDELATQFSGCSEEGKRQQDTNLPLPVSPLSAYRWG